MRYVQLRNSRKGSDENDKNLEGYYSLNKSVRQITIVAGLPTVSEIKSMEICYNGKKTFPHFITEYLRIEESGKCFDTGEMVGMYDGSSCLTTCQKSKISEAKYKLSIAKKDLDKRTVFVCNNIHHPALFSVEFKVQPQGLNWIGGESPHLLKDGHRLRALCKIRHLHSPTPCQIYWDSSRSSFIIKCEYPVRAITTAQSAAFYVFDGLIYHGGGPIWTHGPLLRFYVLSKANLYNRKRRCRRAVSHPNRIWIVFKHLLLGYTTFVTIATTTGSRHTPYNHSRPFYPTNNLNNTTNNIRPFPHRANLNLHHHSSHLDFHPSPLHLTDAVSDLSLALSVAPDDNGDIRTMIYAFGGCVSPPDSDLDPLLPPSVHHCSRTTTDVHVYDPRYQEQNTSPSERRASLPRGRHSHSSVSALGGTVWVVGGRDEEGRVVKEIDVYDPLMDAWRTIGEGIDSILLSSSDTHANAPKEGGGTDEPKRYLISHQAVISVENGAILLLIGGYTTEYRSVPHVLAIDVESTLRTNTLVYRFLPSLVQNRGGASAVLYRSHRPMEKGREEGGGAEGYHSYVLVGGGTTHDDGHCEVIGRVEVYDGIKKVWGVLGEGMISGRAGGDLFLWHTDEAIGSDGKRGRKRKKYVVALGGMKKGFFDAETGICRPEVDKNGGKGGSWWKWGTDKEKEGKAVEDECEGGGGEDGNPSICPVRSMEVLDVTDYIDGGASELDNVPWTIWEGTTVPQDLLSRYSAIPYPFSTTTGAPIDLIFLFGGVLRPERFNDGSSSKTDTTVRARRGLTTTTAIVATERSSPWYDPKRQGQESKRQSLPLRLSSDVYVRSVMPSDIEKEEGWSLWQIGFVVLGAVVVVGFGFFLVVRRWWRSRRENEPESEWDWEEGEDEDKERDEIELTERRTGSGVESSVLL